MEARAARGAEGREGSGAVPQDEAGYLDVTHGITGSLANH